MYILTKESDMDCDDAFDLESMEVNDELMEMIEEAITIEDSE